MQPVTVEIDTGSASARGRRPDRIWLVRLRRANRHVITTIGLSRTSAERLAEHITDVLNPPEETLDVTKLIAVLEFYAGWLNADIDYAAPACRSTAPTASMTSRPTPPASSKP